MSKGRAFGSQNYFSFILTIKYVSVSIILIMGVIKRIVSLAREEHGRSHVPQVREYSISRLCTLSVTIVNSEVCTYTSKHFRLKE